MQFNDWKFHLGDIERHDKEKGYICGAAKAGGYVGYPDIIKNCNSV